MKKNQAQHSKKDPSLIKSQVEHEKRNSLAAIPNTLSLPPAAKWKSLSLRVAKRNCT